MMTYLVRYNHYSVRALAVCAAVCAVAAFAYGAFLLLAVSHAARLGTAEDALRGLSASTATLESSYLRGSARLTSAYAKELGFVEPSEVWVVHATPAVLSANR